jgi:hypothetical protein
MSSTENHLSSAPDSSPGGNFLDSRVYLPQDLLSWSPPSSPPSRDSRAAKPSTEQPSFTVLPPAAYQILPPQAFSRSASYGLLPLNAAFSANPPVSTDACPIEVFDYGQSTVPAQIKVTTMWTTKVFDEQGHDNRLALW